MAESGEDVTERVSPPKGHRFDGPWHLREPYTTNTGRIVGLWCRPVIHERAEAHFGSPGITRASWFSGIEVVYGQHDGARIKDNDGMNKWACSPTCSAPGPHFHTDLWLSQFGREGQVK